MRILPRFTPIFCVMILVVLVLAPADAQFDIDFPDPSGPYDVGRTSRSFVDPDRAETFAGEDAGQRELVTTIFYPAVPEADPEPAPLVTEDMVDLIQRGMGVPGGLFLGFAPNAYADAPPVEGRYPVLVFSSGLGSPDVTQFGLLEELASHGYIVVAINHPYISAFTRYDDGREAVVTENVILPPPDELDAESYDEILGNTLFPVVVADQIFILNQLDAFNGEDALLADHLDTSRIGVFGFSFGGAAALQTAYEDDRVLAAINMDGSMFGEVVSEGIDVPVSVMRSPMPNPSDRQLEAQGVTRDDIERRFADFAADVAFVLESAPVGYRVEIIGAAHNTYDTGVLLASEAIFFIGEDLIGTVEPRVTQAFIYNFVLAFMNTHVAGEGTPQIADLIDAGFDTDLVRFEQFGDE